MGKAKRVLIYRLGSLGDMLVTECSPGMVSVWRAASGDLSPRRLYGCGLETCIVEKKKCILSITVDEVMEVVSSQLSVVREAGRTQLRRTENQELTTHNFPVR
jgi:hypothetical protein